MFPTMSCDMADVLPSNISKSQFVWSAHSQGAI